MDQTVKAKKLIYTLLLLAIVTCAIFLFACSSEQDGGGISGVKIDDDLISWDAYAGAAKYSVVVDGKEYITEEPQFDLFYIADEERTYKVKVCALSSSDKQLTDYTESVDYVVTKRYLSGIGGELDENGEYTVGAANKNYIKGKIIVPAYSNGKPITAIGSEAFSGCDKLEKIYIPDTVTVIRPYAFSGCTALKKVRLPNKLSQIYADAFSGCAALNEVRLPDELLSIGANTFSGCAALKEVHLPNGLSSIGDGAFAYCKGLVSMGIPASVTTIFAGNPFYGCDGLTELAVEKGNLHYQMRGTCLLDIDTSVVLYGRDVKDIPKYSSEIAKNAFRSCNALTEAIIPDNIISIGDYAFNGCSALESVTIPKLNSLGRSAFSDCPTLKRVEIAASQRFPQYVFTSNFSYCGSLTELVVTGEDENIKSENNCIIDKKNNRLIRGCKASVIPDYIAEIGDSAFSGCRGLERVVIPYGVTKIDRFAFANCNNLKYFVMPDSVTELGYGVFQDSLKLGGICLSQNISVINGKVNIHFAGPSWSGAMSGGYSSRDAATLYVPFIYEKKTEIRDDGKEIAYIDRVPSLSGWQYSKGLCNEFRGCEICSDGGYSYVHSYTYKYAESSYGDTYITGPLPPMLDNRDDETEEVLDEFFAKYDAEMNPRAPMRLGYEFKGWATEEGCEPVYKAYLNKNGTLCALSYAERKTIPNGTKLYAVWEKTE